MDLAAALGIGLGILAILAGNVMEGGSPTALLLIPPMLIVFGGTIGASVAGGTMADAKNAVLALRHAFTAKPSSSAELVPVVVALADKARRQGLLALEEALADVDDPFLERGVTMAVDGVDTEELRDILESEIYVKKLADKQSAKFFNDMGGYAPTIGIVGTVMGLVHVLENLSQPDKLGHLIAGAFVATLWGVLSANLIWLPIGSRIKRISDLETARMEIIIEGVLAIQAGSNPRSIAQKLRSLMPEHVREPVEKAA
jgi:chemotaxis protein MotA